MNDLYRVRRGLFGRSVLQKLCDGPSYIGGRVDSSVRDISWEDVPYKKAPTSLVACERISPKVENKIDLILEQLKENA